MQRGPQSCQSYSSATSWASGNLDFYISCVGTSVDDRKYTASLEKLKFFPNEAFVFPEQAANMVDLRFAASLDPTNEVVKMKMNIFGSTDQPDRLLPTTLIE